MTQLPDKAKYGSKYIQKNLHCTQPFSSADSSHFTQLRCQSTKFRTVVKDESAHMFSQELFVAY